ncbi:MAG: DUF2027 domain-containing protein [Fermentimonas sp.]|jgi:hypothetical protein
MQKLSIGDRVRFLNTKGGGVVKGFQSKSVAIVEEEEHGFDIPILITELVVVEAAKDNIMIQSSDVENVDVTTPAEEVLYEEEIIETPEGEKITACLLFLPVDINNISTTEFKAYFINDSNYYLFLSYMSGGKDSWKSLYNGILEPNTQILIDQFNREYLEENENVCIQYVAFKRNKEFSLKHPCSVKINIDTSEFKKLHSFRENDYFEENAITYYITKNDKSYQERLTSIEMTDELIAKYTPTKGRNDKHKIDRSKKSRLIEVDLHINELIDSTAGMNNTDMLKYQLDKFNEVMSENIKFKNRKIVFIHGKGEGVLKSAIIKELKEKYPRCYYQDASFKEYGYGATMVTIK